MAVAQAGLDDKGQPLGPDMAKSKASWIRTQAALHVNKHKERFQDLFHGKQPFQEWLQTISEKFGCPVAVWHYAPSPDCPNTKVWTRYVLATRFKNGYACAATGQSPVVVVLRDRRYTALLPPSDEQVPRAWTRETPTLVIDLSGAGKFPSSVGTPSVHTPRLPLRILPLLPLRFTQFSRNVVHSRLLFTRLLLLRPPGNAKPSLTPSPCCP